METRSRVSWLVTLSSSITATAGKVSQSNQAVGLDAGATEADQQVHGVRGSLAPAAIHQLARHVAQSHLVLAQELVPAAAETGAIHHRAGHARARAARDVRERDGA